MKLIWPSRRTDTALRAAEKGQVSFLTALQAQNTAKMGRERNRVQAAFHIHPRVQGPAEKGGFILGFKAFRCYC